METFQVIVPPNPELAKTNKAIVNPNARMAEFEHIAIRYPKKEGAYVFSVGISKEVGVGKIAFNNPGRKWASIMAESYIEAAPYKFIPQEQCLNSITFIADFSNRLNAPKDRNFDSDDMATQFSQQFINQAFTVNQIFGFVYKRGSQKVTFELVVKSLEAINMSGNSGEIGTQAVEIGLTTPNTVIVFEQAKESGIQLAGRNVAASTPQLFEQNWDFASMGVGGLNEEFNKIFRRAFGSRLVPPQIAEKIGIKHVRGILLHGPPGTGKTLIARQIGNMLLAREPKVVNGPEVLSKYVGESEANIRKLFAEAEEEQAKSGIYSGLHMIIFDEIDALCKTRGNSAGSSGIGDNVVNQLLSKIDGVNALNNVLLIGMTNRRDLIDEALLRPGRLELQIEIGLPDRGGRLEIFRIHTKKLKEAKALDSSVNLEVLADKTKNFTGAEIAGLVGAATSYATNRIIKTGEKVEIDLTKAEQIKVTQADFQRALDDDLKPALGASEDLLKRLTLPMINWDPEVESNQLVLDGLIDYVTNASTEDERPYFALIQGEMGSGLTTLSANAAAATKFPFIRVYQARMTTGKSEIAKIEYLEKLFTDASKSESSCIVIDDLDMILDYFHIGPRFSNSFRIAFLTNKDLILPKGHRMLVICTCRNKRFLNDLDLAREFRDIIKIPSVTTARQVTKVLEEIDCKPFDNRQISALSMQLEAVKFKLGIKELTNLIRNMLRINPENRVNQFIEVIDERYSFNEKPTRSGFVL